MIIMNHLKNLDSNVADEDTLLYAEDIWNAIGVYYTKEEKKEKIQAYNELDTLMIAKLKKLLDFEISKYSWDKVIRAYKEDNSFFIIKDLVIIDNFVGASYDRFDENKNFQGTECYQLVCSTKEAWYDLNNGYFEIFEDNSRDSFYSKFKDWKCKSFILGSIMEKINEMILKDFEIESALSITPNQNQESYKSSFSCKKDIKVYLNKKYSEICESLVRKEAFTINVITMKGLDKYYYYKIIGKLFNNEIMLDYESLDIRTWKFSSSLQQLEEEKKKEKVKR